MTGTPGCKIECIGATKFGAIEYVTDIKINSEPIKISYYPESRSVDIDARIYVYSRSLNNTMVFSLDDLDDGIHSHYQYLQPWEFIWISIILNYFRKEYAS
jgi:hypothetical protein